MTEREEWARELAETILSEPQPIANLTRQQAHVVRLLQAARGRAVSRASIIEAVALDPVPHDCPTQADVLMWAVRRRNPDIGAHIQTVRGFGYAWSA